MKILHAITSLDKGGAENHLVILSKEQVRNKNNIFISKNSFYWVEFLKKNKIKVFKPKFFNEKNFLLKVMKIFSDTYFLKKLIDKRKPEILHAHLPYMELISYLSLKFSKHKPRFFITKHVDNVFFKGSYGQKKSLIGSFLARLIANRSEKIIAISEAVKRFLTSKYVGIKTKKINVVYYGINNLNIISKNESKYKLKKINKEQLVIGCIARLVPQKSIGNILKALKILNEKNINLVIVGKGPMKDELVSFVKKLKIQKQVIWINFIDDLRSFYNFIDVFVLTSHYEGLGLVFLEAMLSKKPVIGSNLSAMSEIIKHNYNGYLVEPNNPKLLSIAIRMDISLLKNFFLLKRCTQKHKNYICLND